MRARSVAFSECRRRHYLFEIEVLLDDNKSITSNAITCFSEPGCNNSLIHRSMSALRFDTLSSAAALTIGSTGVFACLYLLFCVRFADIISPQCVVAAAGSDVVHLVQANGSLALTPLALSWQSSTSSCSRPSVHDCFINATRHGIDGATRFTCFALDDALDTVFISVQDAELALRQSPVSTLSWLLFVAATLVLCLPCCFVGGSLMCCLAFGFDVPLLARLVKFRCDVPTNEAKQV